MKKKMIFIISMIVAMQSYTANAQEEVTIIQQGTNCGTNCSWSIDSNNTLKIWATDGSSTGSMKNFSYVIDGNIHTDAPWKSYYNSVTSVEIMDGITSIGRTSFYGMSNVLNVTIADSVETFGSSAFGNMLGPENLTCNAANLERFLQDGLLRTNGTIHCTSGDCEQALQNGVQANGISPSDRPATWTLITGSGSTPSSTGRTMEYDERDGSYIIKNAAGEVVGWKGKRIYTVDEAEKLSKKTGNKFKVRYK